MKTTIAIIGLAAMCCGCNTTTCKMERPDGTKICVVNNRFFWSSDSYMASFGTNSASLTANKSSVDANAIAAAVQGAINGAAAAASAGVIKP
jgi:hypothetical protein